MKLLDIIHDHLRNKLGIGKIPLSYFVRASVVTDPIGDITPTLTYTKGTKGIYDELIARASHTNPGYSEDNDMLLEAQLNCFQGINNMNIIKPFIRK